MKIKDTVFWLKECIKGTPFQDRVYVVGGAIRDELLGLPFKDIDLLYVPVTGKTTSDLIQHLQNHINHVKYLHYGVFSFIHNNITFEITTPHNLTISSDVIYEDAIERETSICAIYYNISTEKIIMPLENTAFSLKNKVINVPQTTHYMLYKNPLRVFRLFKLLTHLRKESPEWKIDKTVLSEMRECMYEILRIDKEKVFLSLNSLLPKIKKTELIEMIDTGVFYTYFHTPASIEAHQKTFLLEHEDNINTWPELISFLFGIDVLQKYLIDQSLLNTILDFYQVKDVESMLIWVLSYESKINEALPILRLDYRNRNSMFMYTIKSVHTANEICLKNFNTSLQDIKELILYAQTAYSTISHQSQLYKLIINLLSKNMSRYVNDKEKLIEDISSKLVLTVNYTHLTPLLKSELSKIPHNIILT